MNITNCDHCKEDFRIEIQVKKHPGRIEETFFTCPNCEKKYLSFVTNPEARRQQSVIRGLHKKLNKVTKKELQAMCEELRRFPESDEKVVDAISKVYTRLDYEEADFFLDCQLGNIDHTHAYMDALLREMILNHRLDVIHEKKEILEILMDELKKNLLAHS